MLRRLWLIDDTPQLHTVAEATAVLAGGWEFTGYLRGNDAIEAVRGGLPMPEVILMDYFIGDMHGDEVTGALRGLESGDHRPVIVGYSSMRVASEAIVAAGGDLIIVKHHDRAGINPSLLAYLKRWKPLLRRA